MPWCPYLLLKHPLMMMIVIFGGLLVSSINALTCLKQIDCPTSQICQMPDFTNYPSIWPPCPHIGSCACSINAVQLSDGSCINYVNLQVGQQCFSQPNEIYCGNQSPSAGITGSTDTNQMCICSGNGIVVCQPPYMQNQYGICVLPPPPFAPSPFNVTVTVSPIVTSTTTSSPVSFGQFCNSTYVCDASVGLSCQTRRQSYPQCLCSGSTDAFDQIHGCRPRVYGDLCVGDSDCASGLIGLSGAVICRLGQCRCADGYNPLDNLFWNETTKTIYKRRICIISTATSWVPTGQSCTINPHLFSASSLTQVCHTRAFCHLCFSQRVTTAGTSDYEVVYTGSTPVIGTCREFTCGGTSDCAGTQTACNRWQSFIDPPCQNGMCDCNWQASYYKDRFSRCQVYRDLMLGDRCITSDQLGVYEDNTWYMNNEDMDSSMICRPLNFSLPAITKTPGYDGIAYGIVKCDLPYIEDYDGTCQSNDATTGIYVQATLSFNASCDPKDNAIPRQVCNSSNGLSCMQQSDGSNRCLCPTTAAGSPTQSCYGGYLSPTFWDGTTCRVRTYGDNCTQDSDCLGGNYFPKYAAQGICNDSVCSCPPGYTAVNVSTVSFDNSAPSISTSYAIYCMSNVNQVYQGQECHLDPIAWSCQFDSSEASASHSGYNDTALQALVCQQDLYCLRCPTDYAPDDEMHGICRSVSSVPAIQPSPCGQPPQQPPPPAPMIDTTQEPTITTLPFIPPTSWPWTIGTAQVPPNWTAWTLRQTWAN